MTTEERELNNRIEEVAIKSLRREQLLEQRVNNLREELLDMKAQNHFQNNMIGFLLGSLVVVTILF